MTGSRLVLLSAFVLIAVILGALLFRPSRVEEHSEPVPLIESPEKEPHPKVPPTAQAVNPASDGESPNTQDQEGKTDPRIEPEQPIPVYPNVLTRKKLDPWQMHGEAYQYVTADLMEDVVGFFERLLGMPYTYSGPGTVEFILGIEKPSYTFELPNRAHPDEPGETFTEEFEVVWKSIAISYDSETDRTIIVSQDLNREDVMKLWRRQMEQRAAEVKQGPELYVPPEQK